MGWGRSEFALGLQSDMWSLGRRSWLVAPDHAGVDQALERVLHHIDRIGETPRLKKSVFDVRPISDCIICVALSWRETDQVDAHDAAADRDLIDPV